MCASRRATRRSSRERAQVKPWRMTACCPLLTFLRECRGSQGRWVADCAHVPRRRPVGRRLLLYFAPSATQRPCLKTVVASHRRIRQQRVRSGPVGRSAQRSKGGGGARRATPGDMSGAERPAGSLSRQPPWVTASGSKPSFAKVSFRRAAHAAALQRSTAAPDVAAGGAEV